MASVLGRCGRDAQCDTARRGKATQPQANAISHHPSACMSKDERYLPRGWTESRISHLISNIQHETKHKHGMIRSITNLQALQASRSPALTVSVIELTCQLVFSLCHPSGNLHGWHHFDEMIGFSPPIVCLISIVGLGKLDQCGLTAYSCAVRWCQVEHWNVSEPTTGRALEQCCQRNACAGHSFHNVGPRSL